MQFDTSNSETERTPLLPVSSGSSSPRTALGVSSTPSDRLSPAQTPSNKPIELAPPQLPLITNNGDPESVADNLTMYRKALGINHGLRATEACSIDQCRRKSTGIYQVVVAQSKHRSRQLLTVKLLINLCHVAQIIIGALLTALGPAASYHTRLITILGAVNTILAGILALVKGQGLPERLCREQVEFRKTQDWIEETEALLSTGLVGKTRVETGELIETAFHMYNQARNLQDVGAVKEVVSVPRDGEQTTLPVSTNGRVRGNLLSQM